MWPYCLAIEHINLRDNLYVSFQSRSRRRIRVESKFLGHSTIISELVNLVNQDCTCVICRKDETIYSRPNFNGQQLERCKEGDVLIRTIYTSYTIFTVIRYLKYREDIKSRRRHYTRPFACRTAYIPEMLQFADEYDL